MSPRKRDKPLNSEIIAPWAEPLSPEESAAASLIPLSEIQLPLQQPRRYFDRQALQELVTSIQQHGILQPLLLRPLASGGYELVAGERRYRAAQKIELKEIPAIIRSLSDSEAIQFALIENLQREDLNPVEETEAILQLLSVRLTTPVTEVISLLYRLNNEAASLVNHNVMVNSESEANHNIMVKSPEIAVIQEVFDSLARMGWESFVKNRLPLLKLPDDILEALRSGQIAYTKALAIARVKDEQARQALLQEAITQNLSLSQIREQIQNLQPKPEASSDSLPQRLKVVYQQVKKSKVWTNPKKRKQLEKLLAKLEALTQDEETQVSQENSAS